MECLGPIFSYIHGPKQFTASLEGAHPPSHRAAGQQLLRQAAKPGTAGHPRGGLGRRLVAPSTQPVNRCLCGLEGVHACSHWPAEHSGCCERVLFEALSLLTATLPVLYLILGSNLWFVPAELNMCPTSELYTDPSHHSRVSFPRLACSESTWCCVQLALIDSKSLSPLRQTQQPSMWFFGSKIFTSTY